MKKLLFTLLFIPLMSFGQTAEEYFRSGMDKGLSGDYQQAISDFSNSIQLYSDKTDLYNKADAYYNRGTLKGIVMDFNGAIADLTKAIELDPNYARLYYQRAVFRQALQDFNGSLIDYNKLSLIAKKAEKFNKYLILDEAYIDFTSQKSFSSLVKKNKNLIVLKTFSKCPGIAGLRFSYMITNPKLNLIINSIKPPYDVSYFSLKCAEFLLKNNIYFKNYLKEIKKIRLFINSEAIKKNLRVKDTCANFFYISIKRSKIKNLIKKLFIKKILVKYIDFGNYKDFNCIERYV